MNERIGKLLNRSGGEFYEGFLGSPNSIKFTEEEFKTFTELIIRECAGRITSTNLEDVEGGDYSVLLAAKEQILEHFGIET